MFIVGFGLSIFKHRVILKWDSNGDLKLLKKVEIGLDSAPCLLGGTHQGQILFSCTFQLG